MDNKRITTLATAGLLAIGLVAGGVGWVAARPPEPNGHSMLGTTMGPHADGHGSMPAQHTEMQAAMAGKRTEVQAAVATALGLTADEFQAQIEAGKTVPQIAQERGIDLAKIHEAVQPQLQAAGHGMGQGHGAHGLGTQ